MNRSTSLVTVGLAALAVAWGCSPKAASDDDSISNSGKGGATAGGTAGIGSGGTSSAGHSAGGTGTGGGSTGGSVGTGGTTPTGGATSMGGGTGGGVAAGGMPGSGGSVVSAGGVPATGGSVSTGGTVGMAGSGTSGAAGSGMMMGTAPAGYWIYSASGATPYTWNGCAWTGVDTVTVAPDKTTIMPTDFTMQSGTSGPYHVSGSVGKDPGYNGVALLGFNLNQPAAGTDCTYNPAAAMAMGPPGVTFPTGPTGIAVNFSKTSSTGTVRIQIQGANGATDATNRWCYGLTQVQGKDFAPFNRFFTQCWNDDGTGKAKSGNDSNGMPLTVGNAYKGEAISAIVFNVPGTSDADLPYDITVNGFALGSSAADAPDGGTQGTLTGTIGDASTSNSSTDVDFQRVKVTGGTPQHSYIIQNNNWGSPSNTAQLINYTNNSFTITTEAGGDLGKGSVRAFPSIYQGANGNVMAGTYSTISDDHMPIQNSAIQSAMTTFTWSGGAGGGDYNATYDVWFNSAAPNLTQYPYSGYPEYQDGVSGFVMVWLYKPGNDGPIGGSPAHSGVTVSGVSGTWDVYIGPRGGSSSAQVVSYVATSTLNTLTFDLKNFISDTTSKGYGGIQSSWYLTDVFAGFEIWNGANAQGLKVNTFTLDVK